MKKSVIVYGLLGGALIILLRLIEYRFLIIEHSLEIYGGLVAIVFAGLGIWLGLKFVKTKETVVVKEVRLPSDGAFVMNRARLAELGITPREHGFCS